MSGLVGVWIGGCLDWWVSGLVDRESVSRLVNGWIGLCISG